MSNRSHANFIAVNCAAIPRELIESELFGVEKGAFTGAEKSRPGRFERAHGGVLFLDEIGELSARAQAKLLRVLQTGEIERVGDTKARKVDVRIIAATNANLDERVKDGSFRADLYYRLNVFPMTIPPLRERLEDLPELIHRFIGRYNKKYGKQARDVSNLAMQSMQAYDWPGNVRELENVIERGIILSTGKMIEIQQLFPGIVLADKLRGKRIDESGLMATGNEPSVWEQLIASGISLDEVEKSMLETALQGAGGNASEAARSLNMKDAQFRYRIKKHEISCG
jgi:transcriptional regulator with GAF, ATPase, and Fis domain